MSDQIKPCPFCGSDDTPPLERHTGYGIHVSCSECWALGPVGDTEEQAIQLWNNMQAATRKGEPVESEF